MSLRLRLVAGLLLLTAFGLIITSVAGVVLLRVYLYDRAGQQAGTIPARGPLAHGRRRTCAPTSLHQARRFRPTSCSPSWRPTAASPAPSRHPNQTSPAPDLTEITGAAIATNAGRSVTVGSADASGTDWRVHVTPLNGGDGYVVVAVSLADAQDTLLRMRNIAALAGAVTLILVALGAWFVVTIGLRPLSEIEHTAEASPPVTYPPGAGVGPGTEVGRLGELPSTCMLAQIEQAVRGPCGLRGADSGSSSPTPAMSCAPR